MICTSINRTDGRLPAPGFSSNHVLKLGKIPALALLLALLTFESQQCYVLDQTVTALQHRQLQGLHDGGFS